MHFLKGYLRLTIYTLFVMSSTQKHGMSLLTLYRRSAMLPGPCLLVLFSLLKLSFLLTQSLISLCVWIDPFPELDTFFVLLSVCFSRLLDCSWLKTQETCCKSSLIWSGYLTIKVWHGSYPGGRGHRWSCVWWLDECTIATNTQKEVSGEAFCVFYKLTLLCNQLP